jgi:nicotinate-nucleotide adenylyltransferase
MLELAIAGSRGFAVERAELERPGPSYTVDTLRAIHAREPGIRLTLLLGADAANELDAWHQAETIPSLATVVVFARAGAPVPRSRLIARSIEVPAIEISATEIRGRIRDGRPIRYWVPDPVAEYVTLHRLYLDPA